MGALRWVVAGLLVLGAVAVVYVLDPTTCDVDLCSPNLLADIGIILGGILGAVLALTVGGRR